MEVTVYKCSAYRNKSVENERVSGHGVHRKPKPKPKAIYSKNTIQSKS